jgi:hypothetical protein
VNLQVVSTGQTTLSGKDFRFDVKYLDVQNMRSQTDFEIPSKVQELCSDQPEIANHLTQSLLSYVNDEGCQLPSIWQIWKNVAVPAGEGSRFGDWPMYTRASRSFHGRPWHGFVALQMEAAGTDPITWVGQLRLLLSCEVSMEGKRMLKQVAFLKLMTRLQPDNKSKLLGCEKLQFVDGAHIAVDYNRSYTDMKPSIPYIVVDISNIARVVHVVPDFTQDGIYFLNRFKL